MLKEAHGFGFRSEYHRTYYKGRLKTRSINNNSVAFSPDGNTIASAGDIDPVHMWDVRKWC